MTEKYESFLDLVFYQIYPRSFKDSNNDGMGDLRGITEKIPYLAELGINAVWLSPHYESPGNDGGYDISDYRAVQKEFGTMEDFTEMLDTLHAHGIKLIVDFVPNHTSTEHYWFREARKSKDSPYRDFYIWADKPLNDWVACCESAWKYDAVAGQYSTFSMARKSCYFNGKIVPRANPFVAEMIYTFISGVYISFDNGKDSKCEVAGVCGCAHLVEHHIQCLSLGCQTQHCLNKIITKFGIEPCGAYYESLAPYACYRLFSG